MSSEDCALINMLPAIRRDLVVSPLLALTCHPIAAEQLFGPDKRGSEGLANSIFPVLIQVPFLHHQPSDVHMYVERYVCG